MTLILWIVALGLIALIPNLVPGPASRLVRSLARLAAGVRCLTVEIPGFRIAYWEAGVGQPLVLLHGIGADKDNFLFVARLLKKRFRVIVPDLPGFGDSDAPPDVAYGTADQIQRLRCFAAALQLKQFHLGGNSMGGLIAGTYAAAHPEQVLSLWLLAPAGVKAARPSELILALEQGRELPIFARTVQEARQLLRFVMHRPKWAPGFILAALAKQQGAAYSLNRRIVDELLAGASLDDSVANRPMPPTLIVWGDCDRALDVSGAHVLKNLIPDSRLIVMKDVGHIAMIEAPKKVVQGLLRFHSEIERRALAQ